MPTFKITLLGLLSFFASFALGSKCPQDAISKLVVCYYKSETPLTDLNICNCTHLVFTNGVRRAENNSISVKEDTIKSLELIKRKKENLTTLFTFETKPEETSTILKSKNRTEELLNGIVEFLQETDFDGVELNFKFSSDDGGSKESYASFVKSLSKTLSSKHRRVKREGYDVFEKVQDDITTASYTTQTPKNSTSKTQSIKQRNGKRKGSNRKVREEKEEENDDEDDGEKNVDFATLEEAINAKFSEEKSEKQVTLKDVEENDSEDKKFLIFVRLSIKPEIVAKKYDLKALSKYSDILSVPTHDIVNTNEEHVTYHPSRLMGLSDIQNTDSILDFLTGMGAIKSKMVISLPATVLKFQLEDENKNTPRSPSGSKPQVIDQSQLCSLFGKNNWTIERDEDLTAPYAFSGKTWLAFEDDISINIKGKYILLRELAGGSIYPIDADVNDGLCTNNTRSGGYLTGVLHKNFESLERKPRALVLESLQDEIHDSSFTSIEAGVKLSEYRIVRVVDHSGAVHVIRKNTKTQFECSRQGYFSHPLGCNKFYRCVKFDQYSDEFTVFEYDCPAGLAFDERWEVCVWPGSLPHGAPCTGSSEIAPVPRSHYQCPNHEGYYADPENCRWFFACLDHARDGITPLTAYEFRCPFGLVFNEERLACDWPWLVGACGNRGAAGYLQVSAAGQSQGFHSATFVNGGNLEASFGQYGNTEAEASFNNGFGRKFGSSLKGTAQGAYQGAQSAGFGYIANKFDDDHDRGSFAAFPDYEISGGRIFNKGGVVLDQNVAGISGVAVGGLGAVGVGVGKSGSLNVGAEYFHQGIGQDVGFRSPSSIKLQTLQPVLRTTTLDVSSGGQASFQNVVSTPKPFSVNIPSVQINAEKHTEFSGQSEIGSTTPQTLIFKETPRTENIQLHGKAVSASHGFSVTPPGFTTGIPVVTPTPEIHTFGEIVSGGLGETHLSTPSVSFVSSPKAEIHRFGKAQISKGVSVNQVSVAPAVPVVTGTYGASAAGGKSEGVSIAVPVVTPKPIGTVEFTAGGFGDGIGGSSAPTERPFGGFTQIIHKFTDQSDVKQGFGKSFEIPAVHVINGGQPPVTGVPLATGTYGPGVKSEQISISVPAVTPTPGVGSFEYTVSGFGTGVSQSSAPNKGPFSGFAQINHKITDQSSVRKGFEKSSVSYEIPSVVSGGQQVAFGSPVGQTGGSYEVPLATATPSAFGNGVKIGSESHLSVVSSGPTLTPKLLSTIDDKVSNELKFNNPQSSYGVPKVTPKTSFHTFSKASSGAGQLNVNTVSGKVAVGTEKPNFQLFSQPGLTGKTEVTYGLPAVTPQPELNSFSIFEQHTSGVDVTPIVPFVSPKVTSGFSFGELAFEQTGISQGEKTSFSVPAVTAAGFKTDGIVQTGGVSHTFVTPQPELKFSQAPTHSQPAFGQRYSYSSSFKQAGSQLNKIQPFGYVSTTQKPEVFVSKLGQPSVSTEVSIEQQPIVSVGTISSSGIDQTFSTPGTSQKVFNQSPTINFKSTIVQSTPAPFVSVTPPTPVTYELNQPSPHSLNVFGKSVIHGQQQQGKISEDIPSPAFQQTIVSGPGSGIFNQKSSNLRQEIKSFSPSTYTQGISTGFSAKSGLYEETNAYLPPVTPKTEIFGSTLQKTSHVSTGPFVTTERSQILVQKEQPNLINHNFDFINTRQFEGKGTEFQIPVTTAAPAYQQSVVGTGKPFTSQEKLLGLEISKSVEINPIDISHTSAAGPSPRPIVIEQQPVNLISQKTLPTKQVIQPFYEQQEKETVHTRINNNIPENQFLYHKEVKTPVIVEQKQYLPPVVTPKPVVSFTTAKTVNIEQPSIYSGGTGQFGYQQNIKAPTILQKNHYIPPAITSKPQLPVVSFNAAKTIQQSSVYSEGNGRFVYQQNAETPSTVEQKQYLSPAITSKPVVTYSTPKLVNIEQPAVYSDGNSAPVLPVFEASRIPLTGQKETIISSAEISDGFIEPVKFIKKPVKTATFVESGQPSKVNLLPTVTELPQFTSSQPEEVSVQTHRNFQPQKLKFASSPVENVYLQPEILSTPKPSGQFFQYNVTSGGSAGIKYAINPNIAIPEPPREYILPQNSFTTTTTTTPEIMSRVNQFQSIESIRSGFKASTYLPPQVSRKPSKTTLISVGNVNEEEVRDENIQGIFDKYSGRFGQVINGKTDKFVTKLIRGEGRGKIEVDRQGSSTVQYEISSTTPKSRSRGRQYHGGITSGVQATNKYEEYEIDSQRSFDGKPGQENSEGSKTTIDLKNLKLEKDKKTVIVVSQVSDANPILVGKLAGQCSCQSNMLELRNNGKKSGVRRKTKISRKKQPTITNEYLPPYETSRSNPVVDLTLVQGEASSATPETIVIGDRKPFSQVAYTTEQNFISSSTTAHPDVVSSTILSSLSPDGVLSITPKAIYGRDKLKTRNKQFRGRTRYLPPTALLPEDDSSVPLLSPVPASEIASTVDYSLLKGDESRTQNEIDGGSAKLLAGAAFDRYGPGGWRSFDETLQGSIDCKRPGLFRHPKYCNKFYSCNYDPWKERYTLHVFNCPIQLTYDSSISACNWPVRGPACADDNLLV